MKRAYPYMVSATEDSSFMPPMKMAPDSENFTSQSRLYQYEQPGYSDFSNAGIVGSAIGSASLDYGGGSSLGGRYTVTKALQILAQSEPSSVGQAVGRGAKRTDAWSSAGYGMVAEGTADGSDPYGGSYGGGYGGYPDPYAEESSQTYGYGSEGAYDQCYGNNAAMESDYFGGQEESYGGAYAGQVQTTWDNSQGQSQRGQGWGQRGQGQRGGGYNQVPASTGGSSRGRGGGRGLARGQGQGGVGGARGRGGRGSGGRGSGNKQLLQEGGSTQNKGVFGQKNFSFSQDSTCKPGSFDQRGGQRGRGTFGRGARGAGMGRGAGARGAGMGRGARGSGMGRGARARGSGMGRGTGAMAGMGRGTGARGAGMGRGVGDARGGWSSGRGGGRGGFAAYIQPSAGQVKAIQQNIMGLVTGAAPTPQRGRGRGIARGTGKPTSLMDLVDTAWQRKFDNAKKEPKVKNENEVHLEQFIVYFRAECPDRINGIQTICNALSSSHVNLQATFDVDQLIHIVKPLFTGVLKIGGIFLTRGLGLSKKAVKHDCFERAVEILRTYSPEDIIALQDCGAEALKEEVQRQSQDDPEAFRVFLGQKQATEAESSEKIRTAATKAAQSTERNFPLSDKMMMMLKELDKQSTATDEEKEVTVASRLDVICFRLGINVATLYRAVNIADARQYNETKYRGDGNVSLICEVYFDKVKVGEGQGPHRKVAQATAYENLYKRLSTEPIAAIAKGNPFPESPECLADFFAVYFKGAKAQDGNNVNRLNSLKMYPPAAHLKVEDMVIMESEGDTIEDNAYKILEFSTSRSGMLLEWKQLDQQNVCNYPQGFRCELTVNGEKTVIGMGPSKAKARSTGAAMMLMDLYQTQDVIGFHSKVETDKAVTFQQINSRAQELKKEGSAQSERVECRWTPTKADTRSSDKEEIESSLEDIQKSAETWSNDPLRLWIEDAIVEIVTNHLKKVTLEEVAIGPCTSSAMRLFCIAAAKSHFMQCTVRTVAEKGVFVFVFHRGITVQEMVKILHVNKGQSGRYRLLRSNKPFSVMQQAQFVRSFPDLYKARVAALLEAERLKKEHTVISVDQ